jgi:hypothetical protein
VQQEWYSYASRQNELKAKLPKLKRFMNATKKLYDGIIARAEYESTLLIIPILSKRYLV